MPPKQNVNNDDDNLDDDSLTEEMPDDTTNQLPINENENMYFLRAMNMMMTENRRRDEMLCNLITTLTPTTTATSPSTMDPTSYHIMPDLTKSIKTFDGEAGTDANEWLNVISGMQTLHHWPDAFALETARTHLTGGARNWYLTKTEQLTTWSLFQEAFRKTFSITHSLPDRWQRMHERYQRKGETVSAYFHEKVKLCSSVRLNTTETKEQILIGLESRELCNMVIAREHKDADELLHDLLKSEGIVKARATRFHESRNRNTTERIVYSPQRNTTNVKTNTVTTDNNARRYVNTNDHDLRKLPIRNARGEVKCFNCNTYGHISANCNKPKVLKKCFNCQSVNHISRECPQITKPTPSTSNQGNIMTIEDQSIMKYTKKLLINSSIEEVCLVDNGASVCTIRESIVKEHDLPTMKMKKEICLTGFGSSNNTIKADKETQIYIKIDEVEETVKMIVVPDHAQSMNIIIGRTFTESPRIAYVSKGKTFKIGYADETPFKDIKLNDEEENKSKSRLTVSRTQTIPAYSMNFIKTDELQNEIAVINVDSQELKLKYNEKITNNYLIETDPNGSNVHFKPDEITEEMINVEDNVDRKQIAELLSLLNNYRECIALNIKELGCTNKIEMEIHDNEIPVRSKPYRTNAKDREVIRNIIEEWKDAGIVEESTSEYASPVLLVPKKTGESRLVSDLRKLNAQTKKQNYPMPNIDDLFEDISDCALFTTLDLAHGFLQVPLSKNTKHKTAIVTQDGVYEFTRMIFGLTNAPFEFARLMNIVIGPIRKYARSFLDDILIPAVDWKDMIVRLQKV